MERAIEYEKMTDAQRKQSSELVRQRLQALLADRFRLALRRESREQVVYALVVAKNPPTLKESQDQTKSGMIARGRGRLLGRGAVLDMAALYLGVELGRPVINRTGLTAHYDCEIRPKRVHRHSGIGSQVGTGKGGGGDLSSGWKSRWTANATALPRARRRPTPSHPNCTHPPAATPHVRRRAGRRCPSPGA